jgi:XTP/dITP diphosphohydrolase
MARRFSGPRLILASHNRGKLEEFRVMLAPRGVQIISAGDLGLDEPEETGSTFAVNARLKAEAAVAASGEPALADDSGLAARGLNGAPGVHSARWAGPDRDFTRAMRRVHDELVARFGTFATADRRAAFVAVLCLAWPDGHAELFEGRVDGGLVAEPRGTQGFGYDPIFIPDGDTRTFGEMPAVDKYAISHRRRAVDALMQACFS